MPKIQIDGVGTVEVDDSFLNLSPDEQQQAIEEIAAQARPQADPEKPKEKGKERPPAAPISPPSPPEHKPNADARAAIRAVFPDVEITSWKRAPGSSLGRANPSSWHNRSGAAIDVRPIPGMTFEQFRQQLEEAGYPIIEAIDEVKNPSGHATGPHWHVVLGENPHASIPQQPLPPETQGALLADQVTSTPSFPEKVKQDQESGLWDALTSILSPEAIRALMPKDTDQLIEGLKIGTGDALEGLAEIPALIGNPINDLINRATGSKLSTDLAGDTRSALDLPEGTDSLGSAARKGVASGLTGAGVAKGLSKLGTGALSASLAELGATPTRDAVSGGTAALASEFVAEQGGGAVAQTIAGLAGGLAGYKGVEKVYGKTPAGKLENLSRDQANNVNATLEAEIAHDLNGLMDRYSKPGRMPGNKHIPTGRIAELERSYLPRAELEMMDIKPSDKKRLQVAMRNRHLLSDAEVDALSDGTVAGDAVAQGIRKTRQLDKLLSKPRGAINTELAEITGSLIGGKTAGPLGGVIGGRLARAVTSRSRPDAESNAIHLAKNAGLYERLPQIQLSRELELNPVADLYEQAAKVSEAKDAAFAAKAEAGTLEAEGRKIGIRNDRDDIRPSGGWRGLVYDRTGLLPSQQDAGALKALSEGAISPAQFEAFLKDPGKLMAGNGGNALIDRLGAMADDGALDRDAEWFPANKAGPAASASPVVRTGDWGNLSDVPKEVIDDAMGEFFSFNPTAQAKVTVVNGRLVVSPEAPEIRNPQAYEATARANQQRVTDAYNAVRDDPFLPDDARELISSALTGMGNVSSRADAQKIATVALDRLGSDQRDYARSILSPLLQQYKRQPLNTP